MEQAILEYRGRVPKRAGSLAKRNHILESTLEIIYAEGLRGVRHRAVAKVADVPLSATTYYFADIDELIVDSFVYFMENNIQYQQQVFEKILRELNASQQFEPNETNAKQLIHKTFVEYLEQQVADKESRVIESTFIQYATRVPALAVKIEQIQDYFEDQIAVILQALNVKDSIFKARLILAFINLTERKAMLSGTTDKKQLADSISQLLDAVLS